MTRASLPIFFILLGACGPKAAPEAATEALPYEGYRPMPEPLPASPFTLPTTTEGELSNGLKVIVVENHESPTFGLRLALNAGITEDPKGKEGATAFAYAMLTDGANGKSAEDISRFLKLNGGSLYGGAGYDGAGVSVSGPKRNLEALIGLWSEVITSPEFPAEQFDLMKARTLADLKSQAEEPNAIAAEVASKLTWGDDYRGRRESIQSVESLQISDLKAAYAAITGPANGMLIASGDITLDEVLPLLEAAIGTWAPEVNTTRPSPTTATFEGAAIYLVDKPGAAQSVVRTILPVGTRMDEDYFDWMLGNTILGGSFTARVNMNLREDKGYTYGARCGTSYAYGPGIWQCSASVATPVTTPALLELRKEIDGILADKPATAEELEYFQASLVNGFPSRYETPGVLASQMRDQWQYQLPADWLERYIPGVQSVTLEGANAALQAHIDTSKMIYMVVGDKSVIGESLNELGLPIIELDVHAKPLE